MIWHRQVNLHQRKQRTQEAFRLAIREMEDFSRRQHNQYGLVAVVKLAAALFFAGDFVQLGLYAMR